MMVDTTIYGVVGDGGCYHVDCVDLYEAHEDYGRLYYLDDEDPHGLLCDECGRYIFEPVEQHQFSSRTDDDNCDECYSNHYCGEGRECGLHFQPGEPEYRGRCDECDDEYDPARDGEV
jgi:hypothetical protein